MNAKYNGKEWTIDMTAEQFEEMVKRFFNRNPYPSCDELYKAIVPSGIPNSALGKEGRFGINGIFKFEFMSSDGINLMVKYHGIDTKMLEKKPNCTAAKGWTAQIICGYCSYFTWTRHKRQAGTTTIAYRKARRGLAPRCNSAHIPLRSGPILFATKD